MPSRSFTETPFTLSAEQELGLVAVPATLRERAHGIGAILQSLELDPVIVRAGMAATFTKDHVLDLDGLEARLGEDCARLVRAVLALPDAVVANEMFREPNEI